MSLPTTTKEYRLPKAGAIDNLVFGESSVSPPGPYDVLVKVHAVSLNYRDLIVVWGQYPGVKSDLVPVSDLAGEILAVGDKVKKWEKGDRVSANFAPDHIFGDTNDEIQKTPFGGQTDGMLTQYKLVPEHSLVQIPDHLSYEEASTLPCAALTAWNALQGPVPLKGGDTILVQGTGGVSIFALQLASAMGARVIVTSSSNEKLEIASKLGADHLINYKEKPNWDQEVLEITGGRGVDHIIEVGGPGTLVRSIRSARIGGWIHNIGFLGGFDDDPKGLTRQMLFRAIIYRSILIGSRTQFEDMNRLLSARKIKPVVDKVFSFDEAKEAYQYLASQKHLGKVVIRVA